MLLSLIIPVYNEERSIEKLLEVVFAVPIVKELVVVNDCSRDRTKKILQHIEKKYHSSPQKLPFVKNLVVIHKTVNEGKGAAIRTAVPCVTGDIVTIQDADLELDPNEYPKLMEPFEKNQADIVFGSRFQMAGSRRVFPAGRYLANRFLTLLSNIMSGLYLTDMETCYKVFKREILQSFTLRSSRFGIEPELVAYAARGDWRIFEVPVSYNPRSRKEGKKIGFRDGIMAIGAIIWFNLLKR